MISVKSIRIAETNCMGVRVELPDSPPLLLIVAEKGFVMCGFLNMEAAERLNVTGAMVSGVKTFEDVLDAQVKAVTSRAKALGVETGIKGVDALRKML